MTYLIERLDVDDEACFLASGDQGFFWSEHKGEALKFFSREDGNKFFENRKNLFPHYLLWMVTGFDEKEMSA